MIFLWGFLPFVIILNTVIGRLPYKKPDGAIRAKNIFLLISSLVFYAWGGIYYLLIMLSCILVNYFGGRLLAHRIREKRARKLFLSLVILLNLLILFVFKYFNMTVIVIEKILAGSRLDFFNMTGTGELGIPEIVLPIGISFFTFQAMSYVVDVYRGTVQVQDRIVPFALYISFFPQLIAGPIVRYRNIAGEIEGRKESAELFSEGVRRFLYGLGKKVLLANVFAKTADQIFALDSAAQTGLTAWLGLIAYTLQLYYDFSGYSDMAIGLGRMFGFHFTENFRYPYMALSARDFWNRWHISLSSWFREYVYIPLGGNRKGKARTYLNLMIVFALTGFWHGANFTFILWGLYCGLFVLLERLFFGKILEKNPVKILNHLYVMLSFMIGLAVFRSDNVYRGFSYVAGLFCFGKDDWSVLSWLSMELLAAAAAGILLSGPLQALFKGKLGNLRDRKWFWTADFIFQLGILVLSVFSLVSGSYNPFIYFQF